MSHSPTSSSWLRSLCPQQPTEPPDVPQVQLGHLESQVPCSRAARRSSEGSSPRAGNLPVCVFQPERTPRWARPVLQPFPRAGGRRASEQLTRHARVRLAPGRDVSKMQEALCVCSPGHVGPTEPSLLASSTSATGMFPPPGDKHDLFTPGFATRRTTKKKKKWVQFSEHFDVRVWGMALWLATTAGVQYPVDG